MKTDATQDRLNNRSHGHYKEWFVGDGVTTEFRLTKTFARLDDVEVFVNGALMRPNQNGTAYNYRLRGLTPGYAGDRNAISLNVAPGAGQNICVRIIST